MLFRVYARRWSSLAMLAFSLILVAPSQGQVSHISTLADSLVGGVGGVAIDKLGNIYSADFMDTVWRIRPDGRVEKFATGFYGASGNTFDGQGYLYQSSFSGNFISKVDRDGSHEKWVETGLNGPVGLAFDPEGNLWVNNCSANTISKIGPDRKAHVISEGPLFKCPNGITAGPDGAMYVVNYSDQSMIRIELDGTASLFATIPGRGNGHVAVARGNFYVTAFQTNQIFKVSPLGEITLVAGTGAFGEKDGDPLEATFTFPNGIAVNPNLGDRLFVNDYINRSLPTVDVPPVPLANLRMIKLASFTDLLSSALRKGGVAEMEKVYRDFKAKPTAGSSFTEQAVNAFGYAIMNQGQLDIAIRVFELNAESYPLSFNVYDSLGEAWMTKGDKAKAIELYKKSLSINPANQNATDMIAKMNAN